MAKKLKVISSAEDLVTSREETRAGFIAMALEKNMMAIPHIEEAKTLKVLAGKAGSPRDLLNDKDIRAGLLAASGLSNKSLRYMDEVDKSLAIQGLIEKFLEPAGTDFVDELVYRYLLTKGDSLGGSARNLAGSLGDRKFLQGVIAMLSLGGISYSWKDCETGAWREGPIDSNSIEKRIKAIYWKKGKKNRLLVMNVKLPLIDKNIDLVLMDATPSEYLKKDNKLFLQNTRFIALGELKGGVDPAGSDEHWKTANFALNRVRAKFQGQGLNPDTFFIGAAIEKSMAEEIAEQLNKKVLNHVANLTKEDQLATMCSWLTNL